MTEVDKNYYPSIMEEFMAEIRVYAEQVGVMPTTVIQRAKVGSGSTWSGWEKGVSSPTLRTVDRLRAYMLDNPPPGEDRAARVG